MSQPRRLVVDWSYPLTSIVNILLTLVLINYLELLTKNNNYFTNQYFHHAFNFENLIAKVPPGQ